MPECPWKAGGPDCIMHLAGMARDMEPETNPTTVANPEGPWRIAPAFMDLPEGVVHVWRVGLDRAPREVADLSRVLSPDESERASRFYFQKDRDHYVVARGSLRIILSRYMRRQPRALRFEYTSHGKPSLAPEGDADLRFNLSHSGRVALVGVARGAEIGIDVEAVREEFAGEQIAERFFSRDEVERLRSITEEMKARAFFNCWTRKEAYIKARGEGLSMPLDKFDVAFEPGREAALLDTRIDAGEVTRWSMRDLPIDEGYAAAIVVEGRGHVFEFWQLAP